MTKRWDEEEALGRAATLVAECGERSKDCWALQTVLDELIEFVGPWKLAHFIATTPNKDAALALEQYLETHWSDYARSVAEMIEAANWKKGAEEIEREFGDD